MQLIDRFGEAIEADLHTHYGLDLLDFFRGKYSWAKLERLISQLPSDPSRSRFVAAQLDDDELAEASLALPDRPRGGPSIDTWSVEASYLVAVVDRLGDLISTLIATSGGKPPRTRPLPRPRTALDRAAYRRAQAKHRSLVAEVNAARARTGG